MNVTNITSIKAYRLIEEDKASILIDVRTIKEWKNVGIPNLNKHKILFLTWVSDANLEFEQQLLYNIDCSTSKLFFLCRSGVRSLAAANFAASRNYKNCYNIIDGFEGNMTNRGWKQNNLPWQI